MKARVLSLAACALLSWGAPACCAAVAAPISNWSPEGVSPSQFSAGDVLTQYGLRRRAAAAFVAHVAFRQGDDAAVMTLRKAGMAYRVDTDIDGAHYAMGRSAGRRWRQTPAGTVRAILSDVQGDDLDRWPEAIVGFDGASCTSGGTDAGHWVVACRGTGDVPHWFFIDRQSGVIDREVEREGSRVETFRFDDFRQTPEGLLPFHWTVSGPQHDAEATVTGVESSAENAADLAMPDSQVETFAMPAGAKAVGVPAGFNPAGGITVPIDIDGHLEHLVLDTGTTQMLMDVGEASRIGLRVKFDHAVARTATIGSLRASALPIQTVNLFNGRVTGIIGNEFFKGHVVHIDYAGDRVDVLSRSAFVPPESAIALQADCSEGMPLVAMRLGNAMRTRVALDTGSGIVILARTFFSGDDASPPIGSGFGRSSYMNFLEGPLLVRGAGQVAIGLGSVEIRNAPAAVEVGSPESLDIPLDGIIGTRVLSSFEIWIDYDTNRLWLRPR